MICQVDKYHAQQHGLEKRQALGQVSTLPPLPPRPNSSDDYHSAREPKEFEYNSEETQGSEEYEEDDEDSTSVCSEATCRSSGHDTDWTQ